jgi:hypothetical protein
MMTELQIKVEKIAEFSTKNDWVRKAQKVFADKPYDEEWKCFDKYGNLAMIGADFQVAEFQDTYPVSVYRLIRIAKNQLRVDEEAEKYPVEK